MGFAEDIKEAGQLWRGSSVLTKVVIGVSVFLATSSITSLADVVFSWKGFIKDAIDAYNQLISHPLLLFFGSIGLTEFSEYDANYLIVAGLLWSVAIRILHYKEMMSARKSIPLCLILFVLTAMQLGSTTRPPTFFIIVIASIIGGIHLWDNDRKTFYVASVPIALSIIIVLLLGAINSGLTQPL